MNGSLADITMFFAFVLALSLLVERLIEVLRCGYEWWEARYGDHRVWSRRATVLAGTLEKKLRTARHLKPAHLAVVLARFDNRFADGPAQPGRVPVIAGDLVRSSAIKIGAKVTGVLIGIILAVGLKINLVGSWWRPEMSAPQTEGRLLEVLLTGVAIGLGAGPVHKLITSIEARQRAAKAREA
jgi:hypothetical protein